MVREEYSAAGRPDIDNPGSALRDGQRTVPPSLD
jgi:hypothetical protein